MTSVGNNIKYIRKLNKMSQIEFAKAINISQGSLSDIERGKGYPPLETVNSISQVFDVDLNWLVKGNEVLDKQVFNLPSVSIKSFELDLLTNLSLAN